MWISAGGAQSASPRACDRVIRMSRSACLAKVMKMSPRTGEAQMSGCVLHSVSTPSSSRRRFSGERLCASSTSSDSESVSDPACPG